MLDFEREAHTVTGKASVRQFPALHRERDAEASYAVTMGGGSDSQGFELE